MTYLVVGAAGSDRQRGERAPQEQLTDKLRLFVVESETDVAVEGTLPPTLLQTLVPLLHIVFFFDRVINVWNALPPTRNFASLNVFRNSIEKIDFSSFSRL